MPSSTAKRPIRIGGASGGFTDRQRAIHDLAKYSDVDVIIGDWMSECTMTVHGALKVERAGQPDSNGPGLFDPCFLDSLTPALPVLQEKGVRLAVNAGGSDAALLAREVRQTIDGLGLRLKVAWVEGDEVLEQVQALRRQGDPFSSLDTGRPLDQWGCEPIYAQCYLGGWGIAAALEAGADIVICGRVADAAPTVGAAAWWHGWDRDAPDSLDALAGALMAGHLLECSSYVSGGYYSAFKDLFAGCENLGFPIGAVDADGSLVLTKEPGTGGEVSVGTVISQLVYEIQGPLYFNSDVTASLEHIRIDQLGPDTVRVSGVRGLPPPPTTKVGLTARGGFQAEFHYLFVGLDLEKKAEWTERQIRHSMGASADKFSVLKFQLVGSCPDDPDSQDAATVHFRVFVQTRDPALLGQGSMTGPNFTRWCLENFLQSVPGATIVNDLRLAAPKPLYEYWVALLPQAVVQHRVRLEWPGAAAAAAAVIDIPPPKVTQTYPRRQRSYETADPVDLATFGPTTRGPLGWVVLGRSGDKASDANVGLFVRHDDEWDWLRSLLTCDKLVQLLGREYLGHGIDRFEMPNIRTVHFLLKDHLDRGFNSTSSLDGLGKNLCEFLRCRHVDIPDKFLARGKV